MWALLSLCCSINNTVTQIIAQAAAVVCDYAALLVRRLLILVVLLGRFSYVGHPKQAGRVKRPKPNSEPAAPTAVRAAAAFAALKPAASRRRHQRRADPPYADKSTDGVLSFHLLTSHLDYSVVFGLDIILCGYLLYYGSHIFQRQIVNKTLCPVFKTLFVLCNAWPVDPVVLM